MCRSGREDYRYKDDRQSQRGSYRSLVYSNNPAPMLRSSVHTVSLKSAGVVKVYAGEAISVAAQINNATQSLRAINRFDTLPPFSLGCGPAYVWIPSADLLGGRAA